MGRRIGIAFASAVLANVGGLGAACAADMAVKAIPVPVVAFNWTGCYIGVNGGWKGGRFRDESASVPTTTTTFPVVGPQTAVADRINLDPLNANSGAAGGQVGCRWQTPSNWVFGFEGDADWTDLHGTITNRGTGPGATFIPGDSFDNRARWEASARGIVGRAFDKLLIYGTGGIAFTQVSMGANFIATVSGGGIPFPASAGSDSQVLVGGTIGAGFAYALSKNWDIGAEYRYTRYQSGDFGLGQVAGACGNIGAVAVVIGCVFQNATGHKSLETNEVLFKLNYRFDWALPVVAKY
jgi:outer membrane immunogenic protein